MSLAAASFYSPEEAFLERFSGGFRGKALESTFTFSGLTFHCASFSENFLSKPIVGHGCDTDPSIAALKAAAELTERRLVVGYYQSSQEPIRNSNGWAVGASLERAKEAAMREALERHILTYTFLKSGWSDFVLVDRRDSDNGTVLFLVSPYIQNAFFAGMVVYLDKRFPGVSFGYVSDQAQSWQSSSRWSHAIFEAVAFVERIVETGGLKSSDNAIYNACREWLSNPWLNPEFKRHLDFKALPDVSPEVRSGIDENSGLYFSQVKAGSLLPLFLNEDLVDPAKKAFIDVMVSKFGLRLTEERMPIV